ncbi:MAG TPA: enoyl-CoA hydratase/isomerase family protein [Planctomycetota bacterium]|nr:enoyl-CoA hydratase/isomerase family protein [Planctomycetota bacterium]
MPDLVISQLEGRSALLTLNLPEKRNPISPAMRAAVIGELETLRKDSAVRSVVITGSGTTFCSGMDLDALAATCSASLEDNLADSKSIRDFYDYFLSYPKPVIAAVNGPAVAGGAGLALVCDATIMAQRASFCFSEVRIGFVPAIVGVYLQLSIGFKMARELMLSARVVSADEAGRVGLASSVVANDTLMQESARWASLFEQNGPDAMASTKRLMAAQLKHNCSNDMALAVELNARARQSSECSEGVGAFLSKRKPKWL